MPARHDLIIRGGTLVNHDGIAQADLGISEGRIAALGALEGADAAQVIDASGLHVLPGVIDTHVHFREPGLEHKEDLATGSRAAVLGGVTAVFEMPNTKPPTVDAATLEDKLARARGRMYCDHAFYVGATRDNIDSLAGLERLAGVAGIKVFIGSSTGNLLVSEEPDVRLILQSLSRRAAFHCEDEARLQARVGERRTGEPATHATWRDARAALNATQMLLRLARETGGRVHVLHVTSADEIAPLAGARDVATAEVTVHHLSLCAPKAYERLGTLAQINPPIRDAAHQAALWAGLRAGVFDTIGSDHAPHTLEEKEQPYPASPSGMTGVQTLVPVMLDHVNAGRLSLERFVDLTSHGPQRVYGIAGKGRIALGYDADLTIVDMQMEREITDDWIASRSGWTPYAGMRVRGWPQATIIRGLIVMRDGEIIAPPSGRPVRFQETLRPHSSS